MVSYLPKGGIAASPIHVRSAASNNANCDRVSDPKSPHYVVTAARFV